MIVENVAQQDEDNKPAGGRNFLILQISLFFALFLAPLYLGGVHIWSFSLAAFIASCGFCFYWFLSDRSKEGFYVLRTNPPWGLVPFGVFFFISCLGTPVPYLTALEAYKLLVVLLVFCVTLYYCRKRENIRRLCTILVFIGGGLSLVGLIQYLGGLDHSWWHKPHFLSSVYKNHNHFAGLLEIVIPISLGLVIAESDQAKRIFLLSLSVLMGVAFALTLSRGGAIALTIGLVLMLLLLIRRGLLRKSVWIFVILLILVGGVLFVFGMEPIADRLETLKTLPTEKESVNRFGIWKGTLPIILHSFWLGSGPGTFQYAFLPFRPDSFWLRPHHAHNDYLQVWAECGIFVFLITLALFLTLFKQGLRVVHQDNSKTRIGIGAGCLAALVSLSIHSLVDFNFHIPANFMLFGVLAGILLTLGSTRKSPVRQRGLKFFGLVVFSVALLVLVSSLFFGLSDFLHWKGERRLSRAEFRHAREHLNMAIALNPFNPTSYDRRGIAYMRASMASAENHKDHLSKAVVDFEQAVKLNPLEPYYDLHHAQAYSRLLKDEDLYRAIPLYDEVFKKDESDPRLYLIVGRGLLDADRTLSPDVEKYSKEVLRKSMSLDPSNTVMVYRSLWSYRKELAFLEEFANSAPLRLKGLLRFLEEDDLWQYHRPIFLKDSKIADVSRDAEVGSLFWNFKDSQKFTLSEFVTVSGRKVHSRNKIYRKGEIAKTISLSAIHTRLVLKARSSAVNGTYGYLVVKLDGEVVDSFYIEGERARIYRTLLEAEPGEHQLSFEFVNDKTGAGQDRNVWIDEVLLQG